MPSKTEVEFWLERWNNLPNYVAQESSLEKLFQRTYPLNEDLNDVLIKVCSLNDFYSTNIFSPYSVAKHIVNLKIDAKLQNGNLEVVNEIAKIKMANKNFRNFYSFATKYCSHHKPEIYPIYDYFVGKVLVYFKQIDNFYDFSEKDFKIYPRYKEILINFRKYYDLVSFDLKQIDKYLWQIGKDAFPRSY